jgi:hypothetical protein
MKKSEIPIDSHKFQEEFNAQREKVIEEFISFASGLQEYQSTEPNDAASFFQRYGGALGFFVLVITNMAVCL